MFSGASSRRRTCPRPFLSVGQADQFQHFVWCAGRVPCLAGRTFCPRTSGFRGGEVGVEGEFLRENAKGPLDGHLFSDDRVALDQGVTTGGGEQAGEHGDGCGLACSVWGRAGRISPRPGHQGDALDSLDLPKILDQILDADCRWLVIWFHSDDVLRCRMRFRLPQQCGAVILR